MVLVYILLHIQERLRQRVSMKSRHLTRFANSSIHDCAPFIVLEEPRFMTNIPNRIDRISSLRDFQRESLRLAFDDSPKEHDVVIQVPFR